MIRYFRKLRQEMLSQSKTDKPASRTGRYLKYAIGEILLVVIGILIALQINNWNEKRKSMVKEQEILTRLKVEFLSNQKLVNNTINFQEDININLRELLGLMGPKPQNVDLKSIDRLIMSLSFIPKYNPEQGTLNSIASSGDIAIIQSQELKEKLNRVPGKMTEYNYSHQIIADITTNQILNFLAGKYPIRNYNSDLWADTIPWENLGKSKFTYDLNLILSSLELESYTQLKRIESEFSLRHLRDIKEMNKGIIEVINQSLED